MSDIDWRGLAGAVVLVLLVIFGTGWWILDQKIDSTNTATNQRIDCFVAMLSQELTIRIESLRRDIPVDIDVGQVQVEETEPLSRPPQGGAATFGKWQPLEPNLVYKANSDGFIAVYTGGNRPAREFLVYTGETQDSLTVRTRAGRYDGTVCPVPKDHFWTVRALGAGGETVQAGVTVHWLPVGSSQG